MNKWAEEDGVTFGLKCMDNMFVAMVHALQLQRKNPWSMEASKSRKVQLEFQGQAGFPIPGIPIHITHVMYALTAPLAQRIRAFVVGVLVCAHLPRMCNVIQRVARAARAQRVRALAVGVLFCAHLQYRVSSVPPAPPAPPVQRVRALAVGAGVFIVYNNNNNYYFLILKCIYRVCTT